LNHCHFTKVSAGQPPEKRQILNHGHSPTVHKVLVCGCEGDAEYNKQRISHLQIGTSCAIVTLRPQLLEKSTATAKPHADIDI
jgi:hypothetical protein